MGKVTKLEERSDHVRDFIEWNILEGGGLEDLTVLKGKVDTEVVWVRGGSGWVVKGETEGVNHLSPFRIA